MLQSLGLFYVCSTYSSDQDFFLRHLFAFARLQHLTQTAFSYYEVLYVFVQLSSKEKEEGYKFVDLDEDKYKQ